MSLQGEARTLQRTRPRGKQVELQGGSLRSRLARTPDTGRRGTARDTAGVSEEDGSARLGLRLRLRTVWREVVRLEAISSPRSPRAAPGSENRLLRGSRGGALRRSPWSERGRGSSEMLPPSSFSAWGCRPAHRPPAERRERPRHGHLPSGAWRVRSGPGSPHTCAQEAFQEPETRLRSGQVRCLGPAQRCRCQQGTFIPQMEKLSPRGRSLRERRGRDEA